MDFTNFITSLNREVPNYEKPEDVRPIIPPRGDLIPYFRMMISNAHLFGIPLENHGPPINPLPPSPFPPNSDFERL